LPASFHESPSAPIQLKLAANSGEAKRINDTNATEAENRLILGTFHSALFSMFRAGSCTEPWEDGETICLKDHRKKR
jgi:hypothetical protein